MKYILILTIALFATVVNGQHVFRPSQRIADPHWSFRMVLNASDMSANVIPNGGIPNLKPGFSVGFSRNFDIIHKVLGYRVGVQYNAKGYFSEATSNNNPVTLTSRTNLHFVDFPVDLVAQIGTKKTKVVLTAGAYAGIGLAGVNKISTTNRYFSNGSPGDQPIVSDTTINSRVRVFQGDLNRIDYGLNFSIGVRRSFTTVGLTYSHGLADLSKRNNTEAIRNRIFGIQLTYLFDDVF